MKRYILFFLLFVCLHAEASVQQKISIRAERMTVTQLIRQVEAQTDYRFSYNPELLKTIPPVSLRVEDETIEKVLDLFFEKTEIQFIIRDKFIILKKRPKEITISGFIYDKESHETLISANIFDQISFQGAVSNNFGFYSLTLPPGRIVLRPSYVGYSSDNYPFTVTTDTVIHFYLQPSSLLKEIVVEGDLENQTHHAETGKISFNAQTLKAVPALMGESDLIKALQQMPGVAVGTDAMAGLYVRGGNADENLYLVDGNPLYHVHHLLGLFSTFNPEAVKTMDFYKGSFPARYGGRLSSVVDVRMNDGDMKKMSGTASIGLISSRLNLQGPIVKDKTSYSVSLRRTYLDLIARPSIYFLNRRDKRNNPENYTKIDFAYYFYDFNAKINHKFSDRSRLFLSLYNGKDKLFYHNKARYGGGSQYPGVAGIAEEQGAVVHQVNGYSTEAGNMDIGWGTGMASLNWAYAVNSKLFSSATLVYNRFRSDISMLAENEAFFSITRPETGNEELIQTSQFYNPLYRSGIEDMGYRLDFDYAYNNSHLIRFGTAFLHHNFRPEESRIFRREDDGERKRNDTITYADEQIRVKEISLYAEDDIAFGKRLKVNAGMHLSGFFVQGKSYLSLQPRLSARYLMSDDLSLKASYGRMSQYVHLLQSSYLSSPNDLWVPITKNVKPLSSYQYSLGLYGRYRGFDLSAETYYKQSSNQVEYKDGASILTGNSRWEDRIAQGVGTSYGVELMARKSIGNSSGWIGYTLSWADRQFPGGEINNGARYPAKYDNRHKINAVFMHKFNRKFDLNLSWVYATGNWTTLPEEEYINMHGVKEPYIHQRNNYKMPNYQRLDLSFNYYRHKKNGRMGIWNISIYNAYVHHNSFLLLPSEGESPDPHSTGGYTANSYPTYKSFSLFPIIPSFSYTYKF